LDITYCIRVISGDRRQGLERWILDSFDELYDVRAQKLAIAGIIVEEIRTSIYRETGFKCSAGIAQNKVNIFIIFLTFLYVY